MTAIPGAGRLTLTALTALILTALSAHAAPTDAAGLWLTAAKDAVIEFKSCADKASALCGRIVWDKDAGTPKDTCGVTVARLERYDGEAWRDGWVFDPRDNKKYKGALRLKSGELHLRAFVGTEILGQTERFSRVAELPTSPVCKPS
jgi:uncharacterized protein (DUF2147 family)